MNNSKSFEELSQESGGSVNGILGEIITWKPPKETKFEDLRLALSSAGLDEKIVREMLPRNAFARAAKKLEESRVIDKVSEDANEIKFQFTKMHLDKSRGVIDYQLETFLSVDKNTGNVRCAEASLEVEAERLLREQIAVRNASDVSKVIQKVFETSGDLFPIRDQGGVYFVPAKHIAIVEQVQTVMKDIGGILRRYEIGETGGNAGNVALDIASRMQEMIAEFTAKVEGFDGNLTDRYQEKRLEEITGLRLKLEAYQSLLGDWAEGIGKQLLKAGNVLSKKMTGELGGTLPEDKEESGNFVAPVDFLEPTTVSVEDAADEEPADSEENGDDTEPAVFTTDEIDEGINEDSASVDISSLSEDDVEFLKSLGVL